MPFENRWKIEGRLTTLSPLRIGDGGSLHRQGLMRSDQPDIAVDISSAATDCRRRACIPGATLKGVLRSRLEDCGSPPAIIEALCGSADAKQQSARGGKAEFPDALLQAPPPKDSLLPPYWDPQRCTGVAASVSIERRTRTASTNKLFHYEFVPPNTCFELEITAQDLHHPTRGGPESELEALLLALEGFNASPPLRLGAHSGDGWGRMRWQLLDLRRLDRSGAAVWIANGATRQGYEALHPLTPQERAAIQSRVQAQPAGLVEPRQLSITVKLHFGSHFLVNDPSQTGEGEELPSHAPRRDCEGGPLLPAKSFRGALRSQAEKILRTMGHEPEEAAADKIEDITGLDALSLSDRLFGAPGWRAPLQVSDFLACGRCREKEQEFLAIDRFTGGGAAGLKFKAKSFWKPVLRGCLSIDVEKLETIGSLWSLGLLALTLRDLVEGDIALGFGAAKGYGAVEARLIPSGAPWSRLPRAWRDRIGEKDWRQFLAGEIDPEGCGELMIECLDDLEERMRHLKASPNQVRRPSEESS